MPRPVMRVEKNCPFLTFPSTVSRESALKPMDGTAAGESTGSATSTPWSEGPPEHDAMPERRTADNIAIVLILSFMGANISIIEQFESVVDKGVEKLVEKNGRLWKKMEKYS